MAQVTTATPTTTVRERRPGIPDDGDGNLAGELDLATYEGLAFLSSFVIPGGCSFSYDSSGPSLSIGTGRVARYTGDRQELVTVEAVSGLSLASNAANYVYFRSDDTWEVRDADEPPGPDALLAGIVKTDVDVVDEAVRGRSPIPFDIPGFAASAGSDDTPVAVEADSLADGATRYVRETLADTERLDLQRAGVVADSLSSTTGLSVAVITESGPTTVYSTENKRAVGDPLAAVEGPADVRLELQNATGGSVSGVSGRWQYRITEIPPPPPTPKVDWYTLQANDGRTGAFSSTGVTGSATDTWTFTAPADNIRTGPAVVEGTVYVGAEDGTVYAVDAGDGSEQWTASVGGTVTTPTVVSGTVYIGDGLGTMHALDASDGSEVWSFDIGSTNNIDGSPVVANGKVYFGARDKTFYALNESDGSVEWTTTSSFEIQATPAYGDGTIFICFLDGTFHALDASDGSVQWTQSFSGLSGLHSPAVDTANGSVYFADQDGNTKEMNTSDGSVQWTTSLGTASNAGTGYANGSVYVPADDGNLYSLNASDGSQQWSYTTGNTVASPPAIVDSTVYFGSRDNDVYAVNESDGSLDWSFMTGDNVDSAPAVVDGTVYVGSDDTTLYALE